MLPLGDAIVVSVDEQIRVESPDFIGVTAVLVAFTDRDLCKGTRHLNEPFGAKVKPINQAGSVNPPDLIILKEGASAHGDLYQRPRYLEELPVARIEAIVVI